MSDIMTPAIPAATGNAIVDVPPQSTPAPSGQDTPPAQPTGQDAPKPGDQPAEEAAKSEGRRERDQLRYNQVHARWKTAENNFQSAQAENQSLRAQLGAIGAPIDPSVNPHAAIAQSAARSVQEAQLRVQEARMQSMQAAAVQAMADAWQAKVETARTTIPDFDQVVTPQTPVHPYAAPLIADSDVGPQVAYYLGKNPSVAVDLYRQFETNPAAAFRELGRIEARVSLPPSRTQTTQAPSPPPTLSGRAANQTFDPERSSMSEYMADYNRREAERLGVRR